MLTQKTSQRVVIPLKPIVIEILNKYGGIIPKPLSNQKMNQYLKVIGKQAGITNKILVTRTKAGIRREKLVPKYEMIRTSYLQKIFCH